MDNAAADVAGLASLGSLAAFLEDENRIGPLLADFTGFLQSHEAVRQLRYLDAGGMERLRIKRHGDGSLAVVPADALQNKANRYYFRESLAAPHDTWLSPVDLNIEYGEIERPLRPTTRAIRRVRNETGEVRGLLVMNVDLAPLLDRIATVTRRSVVLVNAEGYYLSGPEAEAEWAWLLPGRTGRLATDDPATWAVVRDPSARSAARPVAVQRVDGDEELAGVAAPTLYAIDRVAPAAIASKVNAPTWWTLTAIFDTLLLAAALVALRLLRRIEAEATRARALARAKGDFLALMSHELRTPLNAITGMAYLAIQGGAVGLLRRQLEHIDGAARGLLGIINDILDYSKIDAGRLQLERVPFSLEALVDEVAAVGRALSQRRDVEFLVRLHSDVHDGLIGDPLRLRQVLINLVSNAIKFTPVGGLVGLEIDAAPAGEGRAGLVFTVRDEGPGIEHDDVEGLFRPFEQGDAGVAREFGGTGLGLAIVRQLVTLMEGEVTVDSTPGEGAAFVVQLALRKSPQALPHRDYARVDFTGQRLLLVEPVTAVREVLDGYARDLGLATVAEADAERALSAAAQAGAAGTPFTVVLLSRQADGDDDSALARRFRAHGEPAVVLMDTAYGSETLQALDDNPDLAALLVKPITQSDLFDTLADLLFAPAAPVDSGAMSGTQQLSGACILVVDDVRVNREVATGILEHAGARVDAVSSGEAAVARLVADPAATDAVLLDVQMPGIDGLETARRLRRNRLLRNLTIIAVSAASEEEERTRCREAGMDDFLPKPIDPGELVRVLRLNLLGKVGSGPTSGTPALLEVGTLPSGLPIDVDTALQRVLGDSAVLRKVVGQFALEAARRRDALAAGLPREEALEQVHAIKGAAGSLAALHVFTAAQGVEEAAAASVGRVPESALALLIAALDNFLEHQDRIEQVLALREGRTGGEGRPVTAVVELVAELESLLARGEYIDSKLGEQLLEALSGQRDNTALARQVLDAVAAFDYPTARSRLLALAERIDDDSGRRGAG
jgi:signal transduction histidine kinase/CheY-like chemotaxis protein